MKTKQERINDRVRRITKLEDETILRYSEDIDYDEELSRYDIMMEHFVLGDLDEAFLTDVTKDMSRDEVKALFDLVRPYASLCFAKGDVNYWLESLENAYVSDYQLIAASIFDNFDYLLELARDGGRDVLEQLVSLKESPELQDVSVIQYLRDYFIDDRALKTVLMDMAEEDSPYDIFSNEQKAILFTYPEGTLYSYGNVDGKKAIKIISPYVLGSRMFNDFHQYISTELINNISEQNINEVAEILTNFFKDDSFIFEDAALDLSVRYRDYLRQNNVVLANENMKIVYDEDGSEIEKAWDSGDGVLGSSYEAPYSGGIK